MVFSNENFVHSIAFKNQGSFEIKLDVDLNGIYDISIQPQKNAIITDNLKPLKSRRITFDDDGIQETDGVLNIKVEKTDPATYPDLFVENEVYRNFSSPKGLALIINNKFFIKKEVRNGTEIDEENIRQLFSEMGYKFKETLHNLSSQEMLNAAQDFANDKAHKLYDSCIVFVLTHGEYDVLLGSDDQSVNLHDFLGCFNSKNAPFLKGKPKLFFLQACRGTKEDVVDGDTPDSLKFLLSCLKPVSLAVEEEIHQHFFAPSLPPTTFISEAQHAANRALLLGISSTSRQPVDIDMLIAYATTPNYVSWRNPSNGSWFIQSICEIFSKHSKNEDICSLLTRVNRKVAEVYKSNRTGAKQIPEFITRFQKRFYFFPGIQM